MTPIFREGMGNGIGYSINDLHDRFQEVCLEHKANRRASAFALIFYKYRDTELQDILEDRGAFARLDRLSGNNLTVFFLDMESQEVTEYFNSRYLNLLGLAGARLPAVVFFRMRSDRISDVQLKQLNHHADLRHGFHELYSVIADYITSEIEDKERSDTAND